MISRLTLIQRRYAQKSFYSRVIENIRSELSQNKDMKESLEKFRSETKKLEDTEALKQAREKFKQVNAELKDVNEVLQSARNSLKSGVERARDADVLKRTWELSDTISSKAKETAAFKRISEASQSVGKEIDDSDILSRLYRPPKVLMKRAERSLNVSERHIEPNESAQSVELHQDSKFSQSWNKFKNENPYINKMFELKMRYDESMNPLVNMTRSIVDRIGNLFQKTDMSHVLTEICKADPSFDIQAFTDDCRDVIIPTILEAICQNRIDILSDWCHEAVLNVLSQPMKEATRQKLTINTRILDISDIELAMGKMMEQGPVLVLTFNAQQITYVMDAKNNVVEGDPDKVLANTYVMAFCRDMNDLNPKTAWRLIDIAMQQSQIAF